MTSNTEVKIAEEPGFELSRATDGSAGYDLKARLPEGIRHRGFDMIPGYRVLVNTGVHLAMPQHMSALVLPRSGLALKQGVTVLNAPGLIDSDYRGEIGVVLINLGASRVTIEYGDRIAQLVFQSVPAVTLDPVGIEAFDDTARGAGGFGSTGS